MASRGAEIRLPSFVLCRTCQTRFMLLDATGRGKKEVANHRQYGAFAPTCAAVEADMRHAQIGHPSVN